jgi:hypothetical protein
LPASGIVQLDQHEIGQKRHRQADADTFARHGTGRDGQAQLFPRDGKRLHQLDQIVLLFVLQHIGRKAGFGARQPLRFGHAQNAPPRDLQRQAGAPVAIETEGTAKDRLVQLAHQSGHRGLAGGIGNHPASVCREMGRDLQGLEARDDRYGCLVQALSVPGSRSGQAPEMLSSVS